MGNEPSGFDRGNKFLERSIVGAFCCRWEKAAWKFAIFAVVGYTLAAFSLAGAGIIGARAIFHVLLHVAFHLQTLHHPMIPF